LTIVADAHYTEPRLAALYDPLDQGRPRTGLRRWLRLTGGRDADRG